MKYKLQFSNNGQNWLDSYKSFNSKKDARDYFEKEFPSGSYSWRVGFLVRSRSGIQYKLVDISTGKQAMY